MVQLGNQRLAQSLRRHVGARGPAHKLASITGKFVADVPRQRVMRVCQLGGETGRVLEVIGVKQPGIADNRHGPTLRFGVMVANLSQTMQS